MRIWYFRSISFAASLTLLSLMGCTSSYFVPMELAPFDITQQRTARQPLHGPQLHVQTHPDGMGWTVSATQMWEETTTVEEREIWRGLSYQPSENTARQIGLTLATPITCPGSLVAHLLQRGIRLMGVMDGPAPTWKLVYTYCVVPLRGLDPAKESWTSQPAGATTQHTFTTVTNTPITDGRLQLQWRQPQTDPVGIEYPLTATQPLVDLRLRDLASLVQRDQTPPHLRQGHVDIVLLTSDQSPVHEPLPVNSHTLAAALASDLAQRPPDDWPIVKRIRIDSTRPDLLALAEHTATDLGIPIVARQQSAQVLQRLQQQEVSAQFTDTTPSTIGHWSGATLFLSLRSTTDYPGHQFIHATVIAIETGLVLGQVTIEGPMTSTPEFTGLIRGELDALLSPSHDRRRQGVLIEDKP